MKRVLIIDNYDSFTYTIALYFRELGYACEVIQSASVAHPSDLRCLRFSHLVISPGPNSPKEASFSVQAIQYYKKRTPILGICLGHQCIAYAFGGEISRLESPTHARLHTLHYTKSPIFRKLKKQPRICLYHSLFVSQCPKSCKVIAYDNRGVIMAIAHKRLPIYGIQFHPEAVLSQCGKQILQNFMRLA